MREPAHASRRRRHCMSRDDGEFKGSIGTTYKSSEPWWPEPAIAPRSAPNIVFIVLDDVGFSDLGLLRVGDRDAAHGCAGGRRRQVLELPCDVDVLSDESVPAHGTQCACGGGWHHRRMVERVSRLSRQGDAACRHHSRGPARPRLWHLRGREMASDKHRRLRFRRAARRLAARARFRPLVRVPWRACRPVEPGTLPGQSADHT